MNTQRKSIGVCSINTPEEASDTAHRRLLLAREPTIRQQPCGESREQKQGRKAAA